jgi:hypothetical protein
MQEKWQEDLSEISPDFSTVQKRVFTEHKGKLYIGREEINDQFRALYKEQANYIATSQLYEVLHATILNEVFSAGISQSKDFDNVLFAKALLYWDKVLGEILVTLSVI